MKLTCRAIALGLLVSCGGGDDGSPDARPPGGDVDAAASPADVARDGSPTPDAPHGGSPGVDASAPDGAGTDAPAGACAAIDFASVATKLGELVPGAADGADLGIVRAGCPGAWRQASGSFTTSTAVPIASASKMPSATAILTLVDAGKLGLDEPIGRYLPDWPADKAAITTRMLLSHTSGLRGQVPCLSADDVTLDACVRQIAATTLDAAPGKAFIYGGADYQVAGRIAEIVSGKSWHAFFASAVAEPCGLHTFTYAPAAYSPLGSDTNPRIAGGAASNVDDYLALLRMHLDNGLCGSTRVLSAASVAEMRRDQGAGLECRESPYGRNNCHYGLGWWINPPTGAGAARTWGDAGALGATPWIDPSRGYGALLLIRKSFMVGQQIVDQLQPLVDAAFDKR